MEAIDLLGKRFGKLTVTSLQKDRQNGHLVWDAKCDCGGSTSSTSQNIRNGHTQSCGCRQRDIMRKIRTKHGFTSGDKWRPEYVLWASAKLRAKKKNLEFSIEPTDIAIPDICPLLGIKLIRNDIKLCDNSSTLDRIDTSKGYTKTNIWVVSYKANRSKNNLSISELRTLLSNLENKLASI